MAVRDWYDAIDSAAAPALARLDKRHGPAVDTPEPLTYTAAVGNMNLAADEKAMIDRAIADADATVPVPEPEPLPDFPAHLLPDALRGLVESESARLQIPAGMIATAGLTTAAGAIGASRSVWTDDRKHSAALWATIVGSTGSGKSPALDVALKPIRDAASQRDDERDIAWNELDRWAKLTKDEKEATSRPYIPALMLVSDATTEALAEALRDAPRGLLMEVDELGTWARGMDAYRSKGAGPDRGRYCQFWNPSSVSIIRKGQRPIVVKRPIVSILGGLQPYALAALNSAPDGLAQRFLYCHYPGREEQRRSRAKPDANALGAWDRRIQGLLRLAGGDTVAEVLHMTEPGLAHWQERCDRRVTEQNLVASPALYGKFDAMSARLALVLTLIDDPNAATVDRRWIEVAWSLLFDFYGPHGRAALANTNTHIDLPGIAWIRAHGGTTTRRELVTYKVGGCENNADAERLIATLQIAGAVRVSEKPSTGGQTVTVELA